MATRVLLTEHRAEPHSADMLTLHHTEGTLSLTPDHVLLVDGAFAPARSARTGSVLTGARGDTFTVMRVEAGHAGIINPITVAGTILAVGASGNPIVASTYGDWIADWLLGTTVWPLPFSFASALAFLFPVSVQTYHDTWLEPIIVRVATALKTTKRSVPSIFVAMIVATFDVALAFGFAAFSLVVAAPKLTAAAAAAAVATRVANRKTFV